MKFTVKLGGIERLQTSGLALFLWEEEKGRLQEYLGVDKALGGFLSQVLAAEDFEGKSEKILTFHTHGKITPTHLFICGLGKKEEFDLLVLRKVFAQLGKKAKETKVASLGFSLNFAKETKIPLGQIAQGAAEGLILGTYKFLHYKEEEKQKEKEIEEIVIATRVAPDLMAVKEGVLRGEIFSQATIFARDLVNEPASVTTPAYLASVAKKLASPQIKCQIFDKAKMEKMGMGGILGVARGSEEPPKLIRLEYKPSGARKIVVLIGKGVTFDAGGLSLKPSEALETMKLDMAGGAAILGIFKVLEVLKPRINVVGLIPAVENMPSGRALKPGDILKSYSGKTIEVVNTDAEGRIILADALSFATQGKPDLILDLATLTGACAVALGEEVAGVMGTSQEWQEKLKEAASQVGEKIWPLPLVTEYKELLKSEVADIRNITKSKYGGAITAALFLKEFVDKTPWVHLDIAGPAWAEKDTPLVCRGGSGFGVRTVLQLLGDL